VSAPVTRGHDPVGVGPSHVVRRLLVVFLLLLIVLGLPAAAQSALAAESAPVTSIRELDVDSSTSSINVPSPPEVRDITVGVDGGDRPLSTSVATLLLVAAGALVPAMMMLMTCFTRYVIVLGLTKQSLGLQNVPPAQVLVGLALFLTWMTMSPILSELNATALQPLLDGQLTQADAFTAAYDPLRTYMLGLVDQGTLRMFVDLANIDVASAADLPAQVLVPAFVVSEIKAAMFIGLLIWIPMVIIDLIVSSVLMGLGMMMLPPVFISAPVKLLVFLLVDGWGLIITSMVASSRVAG
jgi:flagellar biosynthetic protein FliP